MVDSKSSAMATMGGSVLAGGGVVLTDCLGNLGGYVHSIEDLKVKKADRDESIGNVLKRDGFHALEASDTAILSEVSGVLKTLSNDHWRWMPPVFLFPDLRNNGDLDSSKILEGCNRVMNEKVGDSAWLLTDTKLWCTRKLTTAMFMRVPNVKGYAPLESENEEWKEQMKSYNEEFNDDSVSNFSEFQRKCRKWEKIEFRKVGNLSYVKKFSHCLTFNLL